MKSFYFSLKFNIAIPIYFEVANRLMFGRDRDELIIILINTALFPQRGEARFMILNPLTTVFNSRYINKRVALLEFAY